MSKVLEVKKRADFDIPNMGCSITLLKYVINLKMNSISQFTNLSSL